MVTKEEADRAVPLLRGVLHLHHLWSPEDKRTPHSCVRGFVSSNPSLFNGLQLNSLVIDRLPSSPHIVYINFGTQIKTLNLLRLGFCRFLQKYPNSPISLSFDPIYHQLKMDEKFQVDFGAVNSTTAASLAVLLSSKYPSSIKTEDSASTEINESPWEPFSDVVQKAGTDKPSTELHTKATHTRSSWRRNAGNAKKEDDKEPAVKKTRGKVNIHKIPHIGDCNKEGYVLIMDTCDCWTVFCDLKGDSEALAVYKQFHEVGGRK